MDLELGVTVGIYDGADFRQAFVEVCEAGFRRGQVYWFHENGD